MLPLQRSGSKPNSNCNWVSDLKTARYSPRNPWDCLHTWRFPIIGLPQLWACHLPGHRASWDGPNLKKSYSPSPRLHSRHHHHGLQCFGQTVCAFLLKCNVLSSCAFVSKSSPGLTQKQVLHNKPTLHCLKVNTYCLVSAHFTIRLILTFSPLQE